MTDNVIILGAGASVDAGIPVLANFVERMWEFAITGKQNGQELSDEDKTIFTEAMKVRYELDGYHGRAAFDDRNIEDILSILSFNLIGGKKSDQEKLNWFMKAITRTIELTCTVKHNGRLNQIQGDGPEIYRDFWNKLFERFENAPISFPTIISFNYDLVLERSLFQQLVGVRYNRYNELFHFGGIQLKYHCGFSNDLTYEAQYAEYGQFAKDRQNGMILEESNNSVPKNLLEIELLKLHGSLNFSTDKNEKFIPTNVANKPHILPPIINKWAGKNEESMWSTGLKRLRDAKNVIIVGYSLPQTDIYMQYFLRAGIGPNLNINKIIVFNPVLFTHGEQNDAMRKRFGNCFSPQLQSRIDFVPLVGSLPGAGTFEHFVKSIGYNNSLFFG
jgi:hypothetical protein